MKFTLYYRVIVCIVLYACAIAWGAVEKDMQTWMNVTAIGSADEKSKDFKRFLLWLEGQERLGDNSTRMTQTLFRTGIGYAIHDETSLWVGYAWIRTGFPLTTASFEENRIWEQWLWVKNYPSFTLSSRTRTEQRFSNNNTKVAYRIRQFVKLATPFPKHPNTRFVIYDELFWHKNDFIGNNGKGFDQNRAFIGLGFDINGYTSIETGYLNQYIRRFGIPNFNANIFSTTVFFRF